MKAPRQDKPADIVTSPTANTLALLCLPLILFCPIVINTSSQGFKVACMLLPDFFLSLFVQLKHFFSLLFPGASCVFFFTGPFEGVGSPPVLLVATV